LIFEHLLETIVPYISGAIETVGVIIIFLGAIKSLYIFIKNGFDLGDKEAAVTLTKAMSMSLSFLLAGEILHTLLTRTIEDLIVIVGIAGLRVGLHFVLHWEIKVTDEGHEEEKKLAKNK